MRTLYTQTEKQDGQFETHKNAELQQQLNSCTQKLHRAERTIEQQIQEMKQMVTCPNCMRKAPCHANLAATCQIVL